jgi:hypothetical protein
MYITPRPSRRLGDLRVVREVHLWAARAARGWHNTMPSGRKCETLAIVSAEAWAFYLTQRARQQLN